MKPDLYWPPCGWHPQDIAPWVDEPLGNPYRMPKPIFIPIPTDREQRLEDALVDIAHDTATIEGAKRRAIEALK